MKQVRLWLLVCGCMFGVCIEANTACAVEGFIYLPPGPTFANPMEPDQKNVHESRILFARAASEVYGATSYGGPQTLYGVGYLFRRRFQWQTFTMFAPQGGFNLFFGDTAQLDGSAGNRFSLQVPLGIHYAVRLIRTRSADKYGRSLSFNIGLMTPLSLDKVAAGISHTGTIGGQTGLSYGIPAGKWFVDVHAQLSNLVFGYYVTNHTLNDKLRRLDTLPFTVGQGIQALHHGWNIALCFDWSFGQSFSELGQDGVLVGALSVKILQ